MPILKRRGLTRSLRHEGLGAVFCGLFGRSFFGLKSVRDNYIILLKQLIGNKETEKDLTNVL